MVNFRAVSTESYPIALDYLPGRTNMTEGRTNRTFVGHYKGHEEIDNSVSPTPEMIADALHQ